MALSVFDTGFGFAEAGWAGLYHGVCTLGMLLGVLFL
jgi:hypothetical protein